MRKLFLLFWLMIPPVALIYHAMAGPEHQTMDAIGASLGEARELVAAEEWQQAVPKFEDALQNIPVDAVDEGRRVRLEMARAKMNASRLPEAHAELKTLLDEQLEDKNADPSLVAATRDAMAHSQFYMTWLMRLEGVNREEWEPEIESARQNFRLLAESAGDSADAETHRRDLEATIRLARLDLSDLQGLPLPSQ